jgi:hypothetical protein
MLIFEVLVLSRIPVTTVVVACPANVPSAYFKFLDGYADKIDISPCQAATRKTAATMSHGD